MNISESVNIINEHEYSPTRKSFLSPGTPFLAIK